MTVDAYDPCPCGSGKKFKWCCQPVHAEIARAWEQEENNQHDTALKTIAEVVAKHPTNPEVYGQQAHLLYINQKPEEAESALEKAFAINPNYPFGLSLQARFRFSENEFRGALILARKAADAYADDAAGPLAELYGMIFDCEMRCNRPVAARAALEIARRLAPNEPNLDNAMASVFGPETALPEAAARAYSLRPSKASAPTGTRLGDVAKHYDAAVAKDATDLGAWFNLALGRAWLGDNAGAVAALDKYVEAEADEAAAADAAALGEVLRLGLGMEAQSDYQEYTFVYRITNPQPVQALLNSLGSAGRLVVLPNESEGQVVTAMVLETSTTGLVTVGRPAADGGRLAGNLIIAGAMFRFSTSIKATFDRFKEEVRSALALGIGELREQVGIPQFGEIVSEAVFFPMRGNSEEEAMQKVTDYAARFFEDTWIHRPRKTLSGIAPVDAVGSANLRKKLLGVIAFIEQCAARGVVSTYDFGRLRHKLGLGGSAPAAAATTATPPAASGVGDVSAMNAGQLASLDAGAVTEDELDKAFHAALRLDAQELAGHFAGMMVIRPAGGAKPDRYPYFSFLCKKAFRDGSPDTALERVDDGERHDCEYNGGKRRNDYELLRAETHARRGEADQAHDVYARLIERVPGDFKIRGKAAESMLQLKQPARAAAIAAAGVEAAKKARDRDNEGYMNDLLGSAKRQGG